MGGGGGDQVSVDYNYNARMAAIYERQQQIADEYFNFWQDEYKGMEKMMIDANKTLIPQQTAAQTNFLTAAQEGVSNLEWRQQAQADVAQAFESADATMTRNLARQGVTLSSGRQAAAQTALALARAKGIAGARTTAGRAADQESFRRLAAASGVGLQPVSSPQDYLGDLAKMGSN